MGVTNRTWVVEVGHRLSGGASCAVAFRLTDEDCDVDRESCEQKVEEVMKRTEVPRTEEMVVWVLEREAMRNSASLDIDTVGHGDLEKVLACVDDVVSACTDFADEIVVALDFL